MTDHLDNGTARRGAVAATSHAARQRHVRRRGFPSWLAAALIAATVLGTAGAARAQAGGKLIDLHGSVLVGGMTGRGTNSAVPDIFRQSQGAGFGLELGARLLILDVSIRFLQMLGPNGYGGTMLTGLVGPMMEIPIVSGGTDADGKARPPKVVIRPGLAAGVAFGTLVPVDPPLNDAQLASKGLLAVGRFGVERMFGRFLGLGGELQGGYHYMFGASNAVNGSDHSQGWQGSLFATASFHLGI